MSRWKWIWKYGLATGAAWYLHLPYHLVRPEESLDESNVLDCWGATTATPSRITMERELPPRRWWTVNHSRDLRIRIEILTTTRTKHSGSLSARLATIDCGTSTLRCWWTLSTVSLSWVLHDKWWGLLGSHQHRALFRRCEKSHHCSPASDLAIRTSLVAGIRPIVYVVSACGTHHWCGGNLALNDLYTWVETFVPKGLFGSQQVNSYIVSL